MVLVYKWGDGIGRQPEANVRSLNPEAAQVRDPSIGYFNPLSHLWDPRFQRQCGGRNSARRDESTDGVNSVFVGNRLIGNQGYRLAVRDAPRPRFAATKSGKIASGPPIRTPIHRHPAGQKFHKQLTWPHLGRLAGSPIRHLIAHPGSR
jgi:hypothetical protein